MADGTGESDGVLVGRARDGDSDAFETLVRRHLRAAYTVALAVTNEPADADDICQDAFVTALERLEQCRNPDRFLAWLLTIVRNQAHSHYRREAVRRASPLDDMTSLSSGSDTARSLERRDLRERLLDALAELTETQREVVLLHDLEGWKHREIADRLGLAVGTARSHLHYARRKLRKLLVEHGQALPDIWEG